MNEVHLKSERLDLKPISFSDLEAIHELHSLPETDKFNTLGIPENIEQTQEIIEQWISENQKDDNRTFTFSIIFQEKFIGLIALNLGKEKI